MTGDHHGQTAGTATLLVRALDGIIGSARVQRHGQVGPEHVRTGLGQYPVAFDSFLVRGERVVPLA